MKSAGQQLASCGQREKGAILNGGYYQKAPQKEVTAATVILRADGVTACCAPNRLAKQQDKRDKNLDGPLVG
jgi:hypothetical protein